MQKRTVATPLTIIFGLLALFAWLGHLWSGGSAGEHSASAPRAQIPVPSGAQGAPQSYLFYLFDVSRSMNTGAAGSPFDRALPLLANVVQALSGEEGPPAPQLHRVGTIGDASLNQAVLCQISV